LSNVFGDTQIKASRLIAAGAGTGISANSLSGAGDLIIIYNSGRSAWPAWVNLAV